MRGRAGATRCLLATPLALLLALLLVVPLAAAAAPPGTAPAAANDGETGADALPPGTVTAVDALGTASAADAQARVAPLFAPVGGPVLENAVDGYRIRFVTTTPDGTSTEVAATLYLPAADAVDRPLPVYAFASGTTGLAAKCAPSREAAYDPTLGYYEPYLMSYAARGYVAILPDYLGFDLPGRVQAYFDAEAEARVLLDAIRAVHAFLGAPLQGTPAPPSAARPRAGVELSGAVFTAGYSQGGHAAYAAADRRADYAPEVPLDGMIGFGSTTNVERLLRDGPYYAPYIARAWQQQFGLDPAAILAERWLDGLDAVAAAECVDRAQQIYPFDAEQIYRTSFREALFAGALAAEAPEVHALLEANRTGLAGHGLPGLLVQGGDDIIARDATQERFVAELCAAGSDVTYARFPGVRHRYTRAAGFEASIAWMEAIAAGRRPIATCRAER